MRQICHQSDMAALRSLLLALAFFAATLLACDNAEDLADSIDNSLTGAKTTKDKCDQGDRNWLIQQFVLQSACLSAPTCPGNIGASPCGTSNSPQRVNYCNLAVADIGFRSQSFLSNECD